MKRLTFQEFATGFDLFFLIPAILFAILGLIQLYIDSEIWIFRIAPFFSHFFMLTVLLRMLFRRDYVQFTQMGLHLSIGTFPKNVNYNDIRNFEVKENELIIKRILSGTLRFIIAEYAREDIDKLMNMLHQRTNLYAHRNMR